MIAFNLGPIGPKIVGKRFSEGGIACNWSASVRCLVSVGLENLPSRELVSGIFVLRFVFDLSKHEPVTTKYRDQINSSMEENTNRMVLQAKNY